MPVLSAMPKLAKRHSSIVEVLLIDGAWGAIVLLAERGGHADDLAHATAGAHAPDGAEGFMGDANVAASHEEANVRIAEVVSEDDEEVRTDFCRRRDGQ